MHHNYIILLIPQDNLISLKNNPTKLLFPSVKLCESTILLVKKPTSEKTFNDFKTMVIIMLLVVGFLDIAN